MVASLTPGQKAELILDPGNDVAQDEELVRNVLTSLLESNDESQLTGFFVAVIDNAAEVRARCDFWPQNCRLQLWFSIRK